MPYYSYTGIIRGGYSDYGVAMKLPICVQGVPIESEELIGFKY